MKPVTLASVLMVASGLSLGMAQPGIAPAASDEMLDRPLPNAYRGDTRVDLADLSVRDAFVRVLGRAGLAGGVELLRCGDTLPRLVVPPGPTIRAALDRIRGAQPDLELKVSRDGVVGMLSNSGHADLLDTRVADLRLADTGEAMGSLRQVLEAPEVKSRIAELNLQEKSSELGLSSLPKPGAATPPPDPRVLRDATVKEVLDLIARAGTGARVWVYEEDECAVPRTFTISFPVR